MESDFALRTLCGDIRRIVLDLSPAPAVARAGARAMRELAEAMNDAPGRPDDARWAAAVGSVNRVLDLNDELPWRVDPSALHALRAFVDENADLLPPRRFGQYLHAMAVA